MTAGLRIDVDETADRAGWAVVTLTGGLATSTGIRVLALTLSDLLADGVDTVTVEVGACEGLSPAGCHVLVHAACVARRLGGCLVASGVGAEDRMVLRIFDVDRRLALAR